ncbi:prepilin-type N-terminal cleavage/methylation domain-containing protein [Pseudomonas sp. DY-1]|uniref:GspH/FimT family pseudopilin n=1 Tax=Pseudomonas sp. DY-1 TaxID=1755504 RepID=UPI000EAA7DD9|nr:GspH/FimT family pseudopilin [Pseudomonas sp. DY-1]AYF90863.1 prepilin-type N-terminal cleavage/methylation domain-containing protein [Pseudomonas sp. DY-1]
MVKTPHGFTLIEALIVLTLVALSISLGVPALSQFIRAQELTSANQALITSFAYARQASVTRRVAVLVDNQDGNWSTGWLIYADRNDNGRWDYDDPVLKQVGPQPEGLVIKGNSPVRRYVRYTPMGRTALIGGAFQAGTLTLCHANGQLPVRQLVLNATGRVRNVKKRPDKC